MPRKYVQGDFKIFPERILKLMKERTITDKDGNKRKIRQQDLADYLGIKRQTVSLYLSGQSMPDASQIRKIALYFNVSADYLLGLSNLESLDYSVQEVQRVTGLSDDAINRLKMLKKLVDTPRDGNTLIAECGRERIDLYSAFISDFGIWGIIEDYLPKIIRLKNSGLNEYEEKIFEDSEQAERFYRSEVQKYIIDFLKKYIKEQDTDDLIEIDIPDNDE